MVLASPQTKGSGCWGLVASAFGAGQCFVATQEQGVDGHTRRTVVGGVLGHLKLKKLPVLTFSLK